MLQVKELLYAFKKCRIIDYITNADICQDQNM